MTIYNIFLDIISMHIIDLLVRQISISGVYGPIATKLGQCTEYALPSLGMTWDSYPTLLTRAPREGQGPSNCNDRLHI